MFSRIRLLPVVVLLLAPLYACGNAAGAAVSDAPVSLGVNAAIAQQTADASQRKARADLNAAQLLSVKATEVRQQTRDAVELQSTRAAEQLAQTHTEQTSVAQKVIWTATAQANATVGMRAMLDAQATRFADGTRTRAAEQNLTATATAYAPTALALLNLQDQQRAERERAEQIAIAKAEAQKFWTPITEAVWYIAPIAAYGLIVLAVVFGIVRFVGVGAEFLEARSLAHMAQLVKVINDGNNLPVGFLETTRTGSTYTPFYDIDQPYTAPVPPLLMRDGKDTASAVPPIEPEPETPIIDRVYPSTLKAFVGAILRDGDWTQETWADEELPRGFVLTKDKHDARGEIVYGGYSRIIALFVQKNLIIMRRRGKSGEWNPNAPREVESVMRILCNEQAIPSLPSKPAPSPTPPPLIAQTIAVS